MAIGVFSKETAEQIYQWYQDTQGNTSRPDTFRYPDDWRQPWYLVKLTEDLAAAEDPFSGFTQAKANVLKYTDADNLYRVEVTDTDYEILVTNRQPNVSLSSGAFVWVKRVEAEYVPFIGGGGGGGDIMHFRILEVDCEAPGYGYDYDYENGGSGWWCVEPTHYTGSCGEPPGKDEYDGKYYVRPFCTSPFTQDELEATGTGVATYTYDLQTCEQIWLEITHCADQGC
jgi:hypothetical protein